MLLTEELARRPARPLDYEAWARALLQQLPGTAAFVVDHDLRYVVAEGEALRAVGFAPETFVGRTMREVIGPELAAQGEPLFRRALAGESFASEHEQGGRVFASRGGPLRDASGRVEAALAVSTDVTERKQAEQALHASEARYRALFETMNEGFAVCEFVRDAAGALADFRLVELNPAFERLTGLRVADVLNRLITEVFPPDEARDWIDAYASVLRSGEPARVEHFVPSLGRWFGLNVTPYGDDRVAVVYENITERKQTEAALRESEDRQAFLLKLSDALRPLGDAVEIQGKTARLLREHFAAGWSYYVEFDDTQRLITVAQDSVRDGLPSMVGHHPFDDMPEFLAQWQAGRLICVEDFHHSSLLSQRAKDRYLAAGINSFLGVPVLKRGVLIAALVLADTRPQSWSQVAIDLTVESAERTWAAVERARTEAVLGAREEQYRAIVEGARDYAIFTADADGRVQSWSLGAEAVFGWTAAEAIGQSMEVVFTPEDRAGGVPARELAEAREAGVAPDVRWHARRDGGRVFVEGTVRALRDADSRLRGFLKVGQDVTERRRLDDALRASEARYRTLVDNVLDYAIFALDPEGLVTAWTPGAERVKGYPAAEVVGRHFALFYPPEELAADVPMRELAEAAATGRAEGEGWRVRKGGERFWANEIATAVHDADGHLVGFTKIARDLTERRLAEQAADRAQLGAARDELRRALAAAEEAERQRLARELHDQLGQELTAFRLGLDDAARLAAAHVPPDAPGRGPLLGRLAQLGALAGRMTTGARYLALELRPPELDDLGLESALATYVAEWGARYSVEAECEITGALRERALPADVGSTLYRIVQEALTNVAKHAEATQVSVLVDKPDGEVRLIVEDNGRGFDVEATAPHVKAARRLGLAGMRERAALVGGTVAVESSAGVGTTLYVWLPLGDRPDGDGPTKKALGAGPPSTLPNAPNASRNT